MRAGIVKKEDSVSSSGRDEKKRRLYPGLVSRLRTAGFLILLTSVLLGGAWLGGIYAWGLIVCTYLFLIMTAVELVTACALSPLHNTSLGSMVSRAAFLVSLLFTPTLLVILRLDEASFFQAYRNDYLLSFILGGSFFSLFCCLLPIIFQTTTPIPVLERKSLERMIGVLFVSIGGGAFIVLASGERSVWLFLWFVLVVAMNDSGAYFVGARYSSSPLSPVLSPKKTTLGSLAGLLIGGLVGLLSFFLLPISFETFSRWWPAIAIGVLFIVLLAQLGDLLKSMIKRSHGIKDMGTTLPGHGGVLDRLDGMLMSCPFALSFFIFLKTLS